MSGARGKNKPVASAKQGGGEAVVERPFWCFISYRHVDNSENGRRWASWLHQELEMFEVPGELVGTVNDFGIQIPGRIYPVFRDEEELPAYSDLSSAIIHALGRSLSLVVICSPSSRESRFVNEEVRLYKSLGRSERTCGMVIRGSLEPGSPEICLPSPLLHKVSRQGEVLAGYDNPLLVDFRDKAGREDWTDDSLRRAAIRNELHGDDAESHIQDCEARQREAKMQLIAWVLGVSEVRLCDALDKTRRREKMRRVLGRSVWAAVGLVAVAATFYGIRTARGMTEKIDQSASQALRVEGQAQQAEKEAGSMKKEADLLAYESLYRHGMGLILANRTGEARESFREASEHGHVAASYEYAKLLLASGVPEETSFAEELLGRTVARKHPGSMILLGRMLTDPKRTEAEVSRGILMLREGVRMGEASGTLILAKALLKKSPAEARNLLRNLGEAGDAEACWLLSSSLRAETSVGYGPKGQPEWALWMKRAADLGWQDAKREIGIASWDGTLGPSASRSEASDRAALKGLIEVAAIGDQAASSFLRKLYGQQQNYPQEAESARLFLMDGAKAGVPEAMLEYGAYLLKEKARSFNDASYQEAMLWLVKAGGSGLKLEAPLRMADVALGCISNFSEEDRLKVRNAAFKAYEFGAGNGDVRAVRKVGRLAAEMGKDDAAVKWLTHPEMTGDAEARRLLAKIFISQGKEPQRALELLRQGVDQGDGEAALMLGDWMASTARGNDQLSQAFNVYLRGAEAGNGRCGLKAAAMLRGGKGTAVNFARADKLERSAAETGDPYCMLERSRRLIERGLSPSSAAEAHAWLSLASKMGLVKECAPLFQRISGQMNEPTRAVSAKLLEDYYDRLNGRKRTEKPGLNK